MANNTGKKILSLWFCNDLGKQHDRNVSLDTGHLQLDAVIHREFPLHFPSALWGFAGGKQQNESQEKVSQAFTQVSVFCMAV